MTDISVSTADGLLSALATAQSGDVVRLQAGTYSGILLQNLTFASGVQITSADPAHPATLMDLTVRNCSGLLFSNLEFNAAGSTAYYPFQVADSSNVHFSNMYIHGSLNNDPKDDTSGLLIRESDNVSVTNSEFEQLSFGINHLNTTHLNFSGNAFHDLRADGIRGGGSSWVTINGNSFTDFYTIDSDHPDAIQFWTTNSTVVPHHIVVTNNVITRGDGVPMQGIFMRDEIGTLHYEDVTISGNMMVGTLWNGITLMGGGTRVTISDNEVASLPDQLTWIRVEDVTDGTISNNSAGDYIYVRNSGVVLTSNTTFNPTVEVANQLLTEWLAAHPGMLDLLSEGQVSQVTPPPPSGLVLTGTDGADNLVASSTSAMKILGLGANDRLTGGAGDHMLLGGTGDDQYTVTDVRNRVLEANGEGTDTVTSNVDFSLSANVENLALAGSAIRGNGNDLDNLILGNSAANVIDGNGGADSMRGGAGDDVYGVDNALDRIVESASAGVDRVNSTVDHVLGANVENLRLYDAAVKGYGNDLANRITGNDSANILEGYAGADVLSGFGGDDRIGGGIANDQLSGGDGDDLLYCGTGSDKAYGEAGNDRLFGDDGNDFLYGGAGADLLCGGAGKDTFVFASSDFASGPVFDTVTDFAGDVIDLKQIDANVNTARNDAFKFIGNSEFSHTAGQLRYYVDHGDAYVCGDVNGDGVADFTICVAGVTSLASNAFGL